MAPVPICEKKTVKTELPPFCPSTNQEILKLVNHLPELESASLLNEPLSFSAGAQGVIGNSWLISLLKSLS